LFHPLHKGVPLLRGNHPGIEIVYNQQHDACVALPMNWELCFSDVGWTEFTRQIEQALQTGGLSRQDEDDTVGDRAERQRNLLTGQIAPSLDDADEQDPARLWNDDL